MAGDWIKMRTDLHTHPKVVRMASALDADILRVVGGLHSAWCIFDAHSVDGFLDGYSADRLDERIRFIGLSRQMVDVGWLKETRDGLLMPRFDAHNGQSAKRRAQDADRKKRVRKMSASQADKMRTREEKNRKDLKDPPNPPSKKPKGGDGKKFDPLKMVLPDWLAVELWAIWINYRERKRRPVETPEHAADLIAQLAGFRGSGFSVEAVITHSVASGRSRLVAPREPPRDPLKISEPDDEIPEGFRG